MASPKPVSVDDFLEEEHLPLGQVTIRRLAWRSQIRVPLFHTLVDQGILEVVERKKPFALTIVKQPTPPRMEWIKQMMKSLNMRPLIRLAELAKMLNMKADDLRERCESKGLKFPYYPSYRELLSPRDVGRVLRAGIVPKASGQWRFDRMSLVQFLTGTEWGQQMKYQVLPYSAYLEREVKRIAHLKEPDRTFRAVALFESLNDAKTLAKCLKKYRERRDHPEVAQAEKSVEDLMSLVAGGS
jgi:hypothetical protein